MRYLGVLSEGEVSHDAKGEVEEGDEDHAAVQQPPVPVGALHGVLDGHREEVPLECKRRRAEEQRGGLQLDERKRWRRIPVIDAVAQHHSHRRHHREHPQRRERRQIPVPCIQPGAGTGTSTGTGTFVHRRACTDERALHVADEGEEDEDGDEHQHVQPLVDLLVDVVQCLSYVCPRITHAYLSIERFINI